MPRHRLWSGGGYTQEYRNSCWAACSRYVNNFCHAQSGQGSDYLTDGGFATAIGHSVNAETAIEGILDKAHMWDGHDFAYIPTFAEIKAEIVPGRMICVCVNPTRHGYLCKAPMVGGHYVVILGYSDEGEIGIMDPADGSINWQTYHQTNYTPPQGADMYWCGTDYTNGHPMS